MDPSQPHLLILNPPTLLKYHLPDLTTRYNLLTPYTSQLPLHAYLTLHCHSVTAMLCAGHSKVTSEDTSRDSDYSKGLLKAPRVPTEKCMTRWGTFTKALDRFGKLKSMGKDPVIAAKRAGIGTQLPKAISEDLAHKDRQQWPAKAAAQDPARKHLAPELAIPEKAPEVSDPSRKPKAHASAHNTVSKPRIYCTIFGDTSIESAILGDLGQQSRNKGTIEEYPGLILQVNPIPEDPPRIDGHNHTFPYSHELTNQQGSRRQSRDHNGDNIAHSRPRICLVPYSAGQPINKTQ